MTVVNGRRLELAADPQSVDLIFIEPRQVGVLSKLDFTRVGPAAAGDEIEHGALARAVGADDHAKFPFIHVEIQCRNGLEAIEGLVHAFERQNKFLASYAHLVLADSCSGSGGPGAAGVSLAPKGRRRARNCSGKPTIPLGMKTVTKTKSVPRISNQRSGKARVVQLFRALTPIAPRIGPTKVPRPPTATQTTASSDFSGDISLGLMIPTWGT